MKSFPWNLKQMFFFWRVSFKKNTRDLKWSKTVSPVTGWGPKFQNRQLQHNGGSQFQHKRTAAPWHTGEGGWWLICDNFGFYGNGQYDI